MGSAERLTGAAPETAPPAAADRLRAGARAEADGGVSWIATAAAAWLLVLACLATWSMLPVLAGWRPTVVITGSMLPVIKPGDVVLVDHDRTSPVRVGEIVVVPQASVSSGQVAHRVVQVDRDGTFLTKGDANVGDDSDVRHPGDVRGHVRLVVPGAGRLAMLMHRPTPGDWAWAGVTVVACFALGLGGTARPSGRRRSAG